MPALAFFVPRTRLAEVLQALGRRSGGSVSRMIRAVCADRAWGFCASSLLAESLARSAVSPLSSGRVSGQGGAGMGFDASCRSPCGQLAERPCAASSHGYRGRISRATELRPAIPNAPFRSVGIVAGRPRDRGYANRRAMPGARGPLVVGAAGRGRTRSCFFGLTGFLQGNTGTRRGKRVEISTGRERPRRIVVGDIQEDLSLFDALSRCSPPIFLASTDLSCTG